MKNLIDVINEKLIKNFEIITESNEKGDYFLLNGSGISTNKKYQKLAKMVGYKVRGKYYFSSISNSTKEECEKHKAQAHLKDDPDFIVVHRSEFDEDSPSKN